MFLSISGQHTVVLVWKDERKESKATIPALIFPHFEPWLSSKVTINISRLGYNRRRMWSFRYGDVNSYSRNNHNIGRRIRKCFSQ